MYISNLLRRYRCQYNNDTALGWVKLNRQKHNNKVIQGNKVPSTFHSITRLWVPTTKTLKRIFNAYKFSIPFFPFFSDLILMTFPIYLVYLNTREIPSPSVEYCTPSDLQRRTAKSDSHSKPGFL